LEEDIAWGNALKHALSRWVSAIGTSILYGIIVFLLLLCLIIPGIIWLFSFTFYNYVVALRNIGGKTALDYSKNLVQGKWWRVVGISLFISLLQLGVNFILLYPFTRIPGNPIMDIGLSIIVDVISSLFSVMFIVWFLNVDYLKNPALKVVAATEAEIFITSKEIQSDLEASNNPPIEQSEHTEINGQSLS
jgi:hypothetical protein